MLLDCFKTNILFSNPQRHSSQVVGKCCEWESCSNKDTFSTQPASHPPILTMYKSLHQNLTLIRTTTMKNENKKIHVLVRMQRNGSPWALRGGGGV